MMFTTSVAKNFAVFENVSKMLLSKCGQFCTSKPKTSDHVFTFFRDTQDNFPEHDRELLLEVMRGAAKCRNCLEIVGKCKEIIPPRTLRIPPSGDFGFWLSRLPSCFTFGQSLGPRCAKSLPLENIWSSGDVFLYTLNRYNEGQFVKFWSLQANILVADKR